MHLLLYQFKVTLIYLLWDNLWNFALSWYFIREIFGFESSFYILGRLLDFLIKNLFNGNVSIKPFIKFIFVNILLFTIWINAPFLNLILQHCLYLLLSLLLNNALWFLLIINFPEVVHHARSPGIGFYVFHDTHISILFTQFQFLFTISLLLLVFIMTIGNSSTDYNTRAG